MAIQRQHETTGTPVGPLLQTIERGAVVVVTIQVTTPDALDNVVVNALLPGGMLHHPPPSHRLVRSLCASCLGGGGGLFLV